MALSIVQHVAHADSNNANTVAVTVSSTGTGNLLVACVGSTTAAGAVSGISDGTNAFTQGSGCMATITAAGFSDMWYLLSSSSGKTTITATFSGAAGTYPKTIHVWEVAGFTTSAFDVGGQVSDQAGVSTTDSGPSLTTTGSAGFGAAVLFSANGCAVNPLSGSPWTAGGDIDTIGVAGCSIITSSSGTIQAQWQDNGAGSTYCASAIAFKDTGGGGGGGGGALVYNGFGIGSLVRGF